MQCGAAVFGPVEQAGDAVTRPVSEFVSGVAQLDELPGAASTTLEQRNDELNVQLRTSEEARSRAAELDDLLRVAGVGQYRVVPARVIAVGSGQTFDWTATVDAGSRDGLAPDMTVLSGDGLVGRVTNVGPVTSTVLLAADPESAIGARLEGSQQIGVVSGRGGTTMRLELLDPQAEVATAIGWSRSDLRAACRSFPAYRWARSSTSRRHRGRSLELRWCGRTPPSPRSTWSASSSSRHVRIRAMPSSSPARGLVMAPFRRIAVCVAVLTTAIAVQLVVMSRLPLPGVAPDLVLVAVVALALTCGSLTTGGVCGFCAGLALDMAPPADHVIGRTALVLCLVGYAAGAWWRRTRRPRGRRPSRWLWSGWLRSGRAR